MSWFWRRASQFKKHDTVQCQAGGYLMVVTRVNHSHSDTEVSVECQWYDREEKQIKTGTFKEDELKFFDWYHPE